MPDYPGQFIDNLNAAFTKTWPLIGSVILNIAVVASAITSSAK